MQQLAVLRAALLDEYIARLRVLEYSLNTIRAYRLAVLRLFATYPEVPLEIFTPEHIERHVYARPVGPRTKFAEIGNLKTFFRFLIDQKRLLKQNPCDRAERPRWQERWRPAPSLAEFEAIRRQCRTTEEAALVELYYFGGLRLRELRRLRVRDVELAARRVQVLCGKGQGGGKDRTIVIPPRTQTLLRAQIGGRPLDDWLFPSPRHRGISRGPEWINGTLSRLARQAGLPYHLTSHLLRHGFVRLAKTRGLPIDMAAKQLGHASILTTSRVYGRVDVSDLQEAYDRFLRLGLDEPRNRGNMGGVMATVTVKRSDKINVEIRREVWKVARIAAMQDDRSLAAWIEQAVRDALDKRDGNKARTK